MRLKQFGILGMAIVISAGVVGCSSSTSQGSEEKQSVSSNEQASDKEKVKLVMHFEGMMEEEKTIKAMDEIQKMDKYSHVEFEIHGREADYLTSLPIQISSGAQADLVVVTNPMIQQQWADEGIIVPIDDLIENMGLDYEKEFGQYVTNASNNGQIYTIPHNITSWGLYYNKAIFDEAGIPYPDEKVPMTWTEYAELAKKLTSGEGSEKIYGSNHLTWPMYWYGEAIMALGGGEKFYNEEGLSNIEDLAFAKALERVHTMQHVDKSIQTHADLVNSKTSPQAFMNGKYGMTFQGAWVLDWLADKENFPRDFEVGVAPLPVDSGTDVKTWGIVNGYAISSSSAHPELALEVGIDLSRLSAKYATTAEEANRTVDQSNLYVGVSEKLEADGITVDQIKYVFANPDVVYLTEKIMGPNNTLYEKIVDEEVEKYFVNAQTLEETIQNIKTRGDKAIQ